MWARVHLTGASNTESASNNASNRREDSQVGGGVDGDAEAGVDAASLLVVRQAGGGGADYPRKQRWSREAYNAYQREYMRKRRAACD